ncbi:MAG: SpoIIE family protein phosphatase [Saccharofermentanales bacterium]
MEKLCIETCYSSLNKKNEELCGDRVNFVNTGDSTLLVLSDGLGSGVKANILSTLTSKIISTMISKGASIEDTVDTIAHTLPVCKEAGLAYSTFMILQISNSGKGYLAEYDNPACLLIRNGKKVSFCYAEKNIGGKSVRESHFDTLPGDCYFIVSDGVTQAGMGETLSFGWGQDALAEYIGSLCIKELSPPRIIQNVLGVCKDLYLGRPGDDATVSAVHIMRHQSVSVFSGPPKDPNDDCRVVSDFISTDAIHVVCGGTSAEILARELGRDLLVNSDGVNPDFPPTAYIKGIDLVTEGVMTIKKTLEIIDKYILDPVSPEITNELDDSNGGSRLSKILIEQCTSLKLFIGRAVNPAHQNNNFPPELRVKRHLMEKLADSMEKLGRSVEKFYY